MADESDFLIHPAKIAAREGIRFYGHYPFTYTGATNWDYNENIAGLLGETSRDDLSRDEVDIGDNEFLPQCLQINISEPPSPTKLRPPYFKPNQVIGIISHSHLIGLRIPHANIHIHKVFHPSLLQCAVPYP
jgi:hypothetical protein